VAEAKATGHPLT